LPQITHLLRLLNPQLPDDWEIDDVTEQTDCHKNDKGRVFHIKAGFEFYSYCRKNDFTLDFSGERVPCINPEETRLQLLKKRERELSGNNPGGLRQSSSLPILD
jgi:hypothetical protein